MKILEIKEKDSTLIQNLLNVWESSVKATHLFLSDDEIKNIKQYVPRAILEILSDLWGFQTNRLKCCLLRIKAEDLE